jgi:hypothetical protein
VIENVRSANTPRKSVTRTRNAEAKARRQLTRAQRPRVTRDAAIREQVPAAAELPKRFPGDEKNHALSVPTFPSANVSGTIVHVAVGLGLGVGVALGAAPVDAQLAWPPPSSRANTRHDAALPPASCPPEPMAP